MLTNSLIVTVTSLAGSGITGAVDGTYSSASFGAYFMITVDTVSTVFIADHTNYRVRKVSSIGVVTTIAGSGVAGNTDGTGSQATFNSALDIVVVSNGVVYVADYYNHKIRKILSSGEVTTFVGTGAGGAKDGTGTVATLNYPYALAIDSSGNIYSADTYTVGRVRKISPAGMTTTLAGSIIGYQDGTGTTAYFRFDCCSGLAADSRGNIFVADFNSQTIRKITPGAVVTTLAGQNVAGYVDGSGTNAKFYGPLKVAVDMAGNVYVTDYSNGVIRMVTPSGVVTTFAGAPSSGSYTDGSGTAMRFSSPFSVAVDTSGHVYVTEYNRFKLRKISQSGTLVA